MILYLVLQGFLILPLLPLRKNPALRLLYPCSAHKSYVSRSAILPESVPAKPAHNVAETLLRLGTKLGLGGGKRLIRSGRTIYRPEGASGCAMPAAHRADGTKGGSLACEAMFHSYLLPSCPLLRVKKM